MSMRILIAASEAAPWAKAGGLGDVVGALPRAFQDLGASAAVVIPAYKTALEQVSNREVAARGVPVTFGPWNLDAEIWRTETGRGIPFYFVRRDEFFERSEIYGTADGEYFDSRERFIFFSRTIPEFSKAIHFKPDVILANDWQTGLVMALLDQGALPETAGVFAIHNLGYQGLVPPERISHIGLPQRYYNMEGLEYYGQMSLLKAGIAYAQAVTTVSPTYAREIQTAEFGFGLDGLLRSIEDRLFGILNGVDETQWNPKTDIHLKAAYSEVDLSGKKRCKKALLKEMDLPEDLIDRPLIGMVTRLVSQKGCDLLLESGDALFDLNIGLVLLGSGEEKYERAFSKLRDRHPRSFGLTIGFDESLAHRIFAGCDLTLVPSLYEPCGLTQMYALRYGTLPVVRATGGLNDTVHDPEDGFRPGTGFKFEHFEKNDMLRAVRRALSQFEERHGWHSMVQEAMAQDFSWRRAAGEYLKVFETAIRLRREGRI